MSAPRMLDHVNDLKRLANRERGPLHTVIIADRLRVGAMVTANAQIIRVTLSRLDSNLPNPVEWKVIATLFGWPELSAMVDLSMNPIGLTSTWSKASPPKDCYQEYPAVYRANVMAADQYYAEARYMAEWCNDLKTASELRELANQLSDEVYYALEN